MNEQKNLFLIIKKKLEEREKERMMDGRNIKHEHTYINKKNTCFFFKR